MKHHNNSEAQRKKPRKTRKMFQVQIKHKAKIPLQYRRANPEVKTNTAQTRANLSLQVRKVEKRKRKTQQN